MKFDKISLLGFLGYVGWVEVKSWRGYFARGFQPSRHPFIPHPNPLARGSPGQAKERSETLSPPRGGSSLCCRGGEGGGESLSFEGRLSQEEGWIKKLRLCANWAVPPLENPSRGCGAVRGVAPKGWEANVLTAKWGTAGPRWPCWVLGRCPRPLQLGQLPHSTPLRPFSSTHLANLPPLSPGTHSLFHKTALSSLLPQ